MTQDQVFQISSEGLDLLGEYFDAFGIMWDVSMTETQRVIRTVYDMYRVCQAVEYHGVALSDMLWEDEGDA